MPKNINKYRGFTLANTEGFTLIEVLVVIGIIAVLAAVVLVAINPARQFAQARNSQRTSNVEAILNAIGQNIADNKGVFTCAAPLPTTAATIMENPGGYDIAPCLVPNYLPAMPSDPSANGAKYVDNSTYNTQYQVIQDTLTKRITVSVPAANQELGQVISITR